MTAPEVAYALPFNDDDDLELVFNAMKRNHTLKKLKIGSDSEYKYNGVVVLNVGADLSLASSVLAHPEMRELHFFGMNFTEFHRLRCYRSCVPPQ